MPGVGDVSSTIAWVAAQPETKTLPLGPMPTPPAVSNQARGVGEGGSTSARHHGASRRWNACTHPSWNGSLQQPKDVPDTTTRSPWTAMSVGRSAMPQAQCGVRYFQRN